MTAAEQTRATNDLMQGKAIDLPAVRARAAGAFEEVLGVRRATPLASILLSLDLLTEARALVNGLLARMQRMSNIGAEAQGLRFAIEIELRAGALAEARRLLAIAIPIGLFPGVPSEVMLSLHTLEGVLAAQAGEPIDALAALAAAEGSRDGALAGDVKLAHAAGYVALVEGDFKAAATSLDLAHARATQWGLAHPGVIPYHADHIEALVGIGSLERADALSLELVAIGRRLDNPRGLATGMRARGLVLGAQGSTDEALEAFEVASGHHARLPVPVEHARTLLAHGALLRRMKQKRAAREALSAAREIFDAVGAFGWRRHADEQLSRISGRVASAAPEELTETERQIVSLVTDGLSNAEIAKQLFVSVRTVESNLTRVYRKLGVRGRTDLARLTLRASE